MSLSKAAYGTWRLLRALIPTYKIIMHRNEAKRPMKIPVEKSERTDQRRERVQTGCEVLVLIEQRFPAVWHARRARERRGRVRGVVALDFHVDRVLIRILVGLVQDRVRFGELPRRGKIEESVR